MSNPKYIKRSHFTSDEGFVSAIEERYLAGTNDTNRIPNKLRKQYKKAINNTNNRIAQLVRKRILNKKSDEAGGKRFMNLYGSHSKSGKLQPLFGNSGDFKSKKWDKIGFKATKVIYDELTKVDFVEFEAKILASMQDKLPQSPATKTEPDAKPDPKEDK